MTKREFLRLEFLKRLDDTLSQYGFKLNKHTRKTKDGWHKYQVIFLLRGDGWEVLPGIFIRNKIVEDIFHRTSGFEAKYQAGTPTIGCSLGSYEDDSNKYNYDLREETDIDKIASIYLNSFEEAILGFYKEYDNVQVLEHVINKDIYDIKFTGPIFKGSKGLILARLTKRPNYNELVKTYTEYYQKLSNGFYLPEFLALVKDLEENY